MKKILIILPHCSTGGMPQYALKKIELLKDSLDIYVVEYRNISSDYIVQKQKMIELLKDNYYTLGENKYEEIINIIDGINPDIVHIEEIPEYFMADNVASYIYRNDRNYKIIETTHDSSFNTENKLFKPDSFMFVSDYSINQFSSLNIPAEVIEYPIIYKERPDRTQALRKLNLNPNYYHVLNVGLFTERKNQKEIFRYANKLKDKNIQFHFVGNLADNFRDYWKPLLEDKSDNCIIWGERNDVDLFYSAMDLFLFTSKWSEFDKETNPIVLKEAISWNMPILMRDLPVYLSKYNNNILVDYLEDDENKNIDKILNYSSLIEEDNYTHFSIIIPTYNRSKLLIDLINSIEKENYPNYTIYVCHDGDSVEYQSLRVLLSNKNNIVFTYTETQTNNYGASQRNLLTKYVDDNSYLIYVDDDNILYENVLYKINDEIRKTNAALVINDIELDGFGWYNLKLPKEHKILHSEIDTLSICVRGDIAKRYLWEDVFHQDYLFIRNCETYCLENKETIHYSDVLIGKHRDLKKNKPIYIWSHNYLVNNWYQIIEEQLRHIKESELINNVDKIFFCVNGDKNNVQIFKRLISLYIDDNSKYSIIIHNSNNYEFDTLRELHKFAISQSYNDGKILYFHTKGVTSENNEEYNSDSIRTWRENLNYYNIINWKNNIEKLNDCDISGAYFFNGEFGRSDIFAGNYWWSNIDYIAKLPELNISSDRGDCEKWIFTNNPKYYNFYTPNDKNLYFKNESKISRNDVVVISSHPNYSKTEEITIEAIKAIKKSGRKVILATHIEVSKELQEIADYFILDKNNPLVEHSYYNKSWFDTPEFYAELNLTKNKNNLNHAAACNNNYYNGLSLAATLDYEYVHCINFDIIIDSLDFSVLDNIVYKMAIENKSAYFMYSKEEEGETLKTIYFACKPKFILNKFNYFKDSIEYNNFVKVQNSNTNCLENLYWHTLKNNFNEIIIEYTDEKTLFSNSKVNLFSMIEYFTILPNIKKIDSFIVWFSSSNTIDNRKLTIEVYENENIIDVITEDIKNQYIFNKEYKLNKNSNYKIICIIKDKDDLIIKEKSIEFNSLDNIINNGIYNKKEELKIRAIHLRSNIDEFREIESKKSISKLKDYGVEYVEIINSPWVELPPVGDCNRPNDIQFMPGSYKLTPAHYGNWLAHSKGIIDNFTEDIDILLVFECDAIIKIETQDFIEKIKEANNILINNDLWIHTFGPNYGYNIEEKENYFIINKFIEAHAYMIPKKSAAEFIYLLKNSKWDVFDLWMAENFKNKRMSVFKGEPISLQHEGYSLLDKINSSENIIGIKKVKA